MFVLSKDEMKQLDQKAIKEYGLPGIVLMENAGKGFVDTLFEFFEDIDDVLILCGDGNNGGDGFVIARWLQNKGVHTTVVFVGDQKKFTKETALNAILAQNSQIDILHIMTVKEWKEFFEAYLEESTDLPTIIDALYGISFRGSLPKLESEVINSVNDTIGLKIAVDIPSGVEADTGYVNSVAFQATITITMGTPKYGHFLGKGKISSGIVLPVDIGIPPSLMNHENFAKIVIDNDGFLCPARNSFYHKGMYGRIGIIAGSPGLSGAAILASKAALRSGSGLITLFHPQGMETIFESQLIEVMTSPYPFANDNFETSEITQWIEGLNGFDALLIGPGMGVNPLTEAIVDQITQQWNKPLVIDADALNVIAKHPDWLKRLKKKECVLTPHIGEFVRISGYTKEAIEKDPIDCLKKFATKVGCPILLKDTTRIFYDRKQLVFDISGDDGLATGGSGDVLAGIIVSFIGQKSSIADASIAASYLLGSTAEKVSNTRQTPSVIPSDIIENLFVLEEELDF
jgi:NAD(P)H-hydrate epimerase